MEKLKGKGVGEGKERKKGGGGVSLGLFLSSPIYSTNREKKEGVKGKKEGEKKRIKK